MTLEEHLEQLTEKEKLEIDRYEEFVDKFVDLFYTIRDNYYGKEEYHLAIYEFFYSFSMFIPYFVYKTVDKEQRQQALNAITGIFRPILEEGYFEKLDKYYDDNANDDKSESNGRERLQGQDN